MRPPYRFDYLDGLHGVVYAVGITSENMPVDFGVKFLEPTGQFEWRTVNFEKSLRLLVHFD
jgi:hypothetical protein